MSRLQTSLLFLACFVRLPCPAWGKEPQNQNASQANKPGQVRTDRYGDPLPPGAIARLGTVRFRHGYMVYHAVFSPNGKMIASAGAGRGVCLWDGATGKEVQAFSPGSTEPAHFVAFSPDGKLLAGGAYRIHLWDMATGKEIREFVNPSRIGRPACIPVAFSPDGKNLASGLVGDVARLWDVATGAEIRQLRGHQKGINCLAYSPDGKILVSGGIDKTIRLWDPATGTELGRLAGHQDDVQWLAFSPDGAVLASVGTDQTLRLWNVTARKQAYVLGGAQTPINSAAFSPDGTTVASGGASGTIAVWDVARGNEIRRWQTHAYLPVSVSYSPDGRTLVSAIPWESAPQLWDVASGKEIRSSGGHHSPVDWLDFALGGKALFSAERNGMMLRWDLATGREQHLFTAPTRSFLRSALSPDERTVATWEPGIVGGAVRLWDAATGKELRLLGKHEWNSNRAPAPWLPLAFSANGRRLASVDHERIIVWDTATGRKLREFTGLRGDIFCIAYSPDGRTVAGGAINNPNRRLLLWDIATGKELHTLEDVELVGVLVFSPDGKLLASGSSGRTPRLWNVATGEERCQPAGPTSGVQALAFSPDSRLLAGVGADADPTIRVWEVPTGREVCRFGGRETSACSIVFTPDGRTVVTGSGDSTILFWDLTGRQADGLQPIRLKSVEQEKLWNDLSGEAAKAYQAAWTLVAAPDQSVPFLREHIQPSAPVDPQRISGLIADLDSDRFPIRAEAVTQLSRLAEVARPALRKALTARPALEARRRIEELLAKEREPVTAPQTLQGIRTVAVLEYIGTSAAQDVLKTLARGAREARLTQEAKASLERLGTRDSVLP